MSLPVLATEHSLPLATRLAPRPRTLAETGLDRDFVAELISRHLYAAGVLTLGQLTERLALAGSILEGILGFLRKEGPADQVEALIDAIPGAESAIVAAGRGGGLAGMLGSGIMALGARLMGFGLGMSEIQNVARELFRFGRDKIGADGMGVIIAKTPGLSQFA